MSVRGLDKGERTALVLTEAQQGTLDPALAKFGGLADEASRRGIGEKMGTLANVCRSLDIPIMHCPLMRRPDGSGQFANSLLSASARKNVENLETREKIHPAVGPEDGDYVIQRYHGLTSFHGTELESMLRYHKVETIIIAGVSTNLNIPGSSLEAVNRGFAVVLPEDCTAGTSPEIHEFQLREQLRLLTTITDSATLIDLLRSRGKQPPPL